MHRALTITDAALTSTYTRRVCARNGASRAAPLVVSGCASWFEDLHKSTSPTIRVVS